MKCLTPDCPNLAKHRGLCVACHAAALRAVKKKQTTWAQLEELGLALPLEKFAAKGKFSKALKEKLTENRVA